jgi:hypothetical protein
MVNKSDNKNPAITDIPIPEFSGWCSYGYWHEGRLLNRLEYARAFWPIKVHRVSKSPEKKKGQPAHFKSWRREITEKHRSRSHHKLPEASRGMSECQYHIPTLGDLAAL